MPDPSPKEVEIDGGDFLYRAITTADWWVEDENRPSSAAFNSALFSADLESILGGNPESTLARQKPGAGLVRFSVAAAKALGFDVRREVDPNFPDNKAHAHVYCNLGNKARRKACRKLVGPPDTTTLVPPDLEVLRADRLKSND